MGDKIKKVFIGFTTLAYMFMISVILIDYQNIHFKEDWMLWLNLFLLCIGIYYFVETNNKN